MLPPETVLTDPTAFRIPETSRGTLFSLSADARATIKPKGQDFDYIRSYILRYREAVAINRA